MIWHKTDLYTVTITKDISRLGTHWQPVINWANKRELGPRMRSHRRAAAWAASRVCTRLGEAAMEMTDREGQEVLTW
jgi:hypothetical protein